MENMFKVMSLIGEAVWSLWQGLTEVQGKARRPLNLQYWRTSLKKYLNFSCQNMAQFLCPFVYIVSWFSRFRWFHEFFLKSVAKFNFILWTPQEFKIWRFLCSAFSLKVKLKIDNVWTLMIVSLNRQVNQRLSWTKWMYSFVPTWLKKPFGPLVMAVTWMSRL